MIVLIFSMPVLTQDLWSYEFKIMLFVDGYLSQTFPTLE
jgi:hypothetical protein